MFYYKNRSKGSKENRSAKKLHALFVELLECYSISSSKYIEPLKEIIEQTIVDLNQEAIEESKKNQSEIDDLSIKLERLKECYVFEEINQAQYQKFKLKLEADIEKNRLKLLSSSFNSSNLKKAVEKAINFALNLPSLWQSGSIEEKRKLQYMLFPEGIEYDFKNHQFRTFRVNSIFNVISCLPVSSEGKRYSSGKFQ